MLRGSSGSVALLIISINSASCFRAVAPLLRCHSLGTFSRAFGGARRLRGASHSTLAMALPPEVQYERLAAIPAVAGGFLLPKPTSAAGPPPVLLRRNQKDLFNNEPRSHLLQFSPLGDQLTRQAFPTELRDVGAMVPAPSGELLALVRTRTVDGKKEQSLEVWNGDMLLATVKANEEKHGDIYTADVFSSFEWSPDSSRLLYVAETPKAKAKSFWRQNCESGEKGVGKEHAYQDDWGELSTGKSLSRLFVLHVPTKTVKAVEGVPSRFAAGQAIWSPDSTAVVFTAFDIEPRRLGVRFYNTRKSRIAILPAPTFSTSAQADDPPQQGVQVSSSTPVPKTDLLRWLSAEEEWSARNPKLSPDGSQIIFVVSARSTAHFSASKLLCAPWPKGPASAAEILRTRTILDIVDVPESPDDFPGLFLAAEQLPRRVWLADSRRIVLHSDWRSRRELVVIDTDKEGPSAVERVRLSTPELDQGSWVLIDVAGTHLLAAHSSPSRAPTAHVVQLPSVASDGAGGCVVAEKQWELVGPESEGAKLLEGIEWTVLPVRARDCQQGMEGLYDAILLEPAEAKQKAVNGSGPKIPLIAYPHGGPHSNQGAEHYAACAILVLQGYSVLLVNYRGSTGYGQAQVESLFGKVGSQDVSDMKTAVEEALKAHDYLDASRVAACGGSHGGFLSLHLVGQHGDTFKAAAVRNPVTNIATMYGATDIPDWCYTETGSEATFAQPTAAQYAKALEMSPMAHVSKITAPVLLLVGGDDRRVPPFQSKEFYYALKDRGAEVEMLWYDKHTHGLVETPKGEGDGLVNICYFFKKFL